MVLQGALLVQGFESLPVVLTYSAGPVDGAVTLTLAVPEAAELAALTAVTFTDPPDGTLAGAV